ncbi:MAG: serine/threonine protein kinase [Candidatus Didemnitutus sp.]|nr:serine/threonine protein kinase [Candidatus Didemnitutus sp.]
MPSREKELFAAALDLPPAERSGYLAGACGGDEVLRVRVEGLLAAAESAGDFLGGDEVDVGEQIGTRIGPYVLAEKIGEGGFGVVYRAEQEQPMRRSVALKILKLGMDTRAVVARFEAERQALALMNHPNIARVFDGGATPAGRPYFVMELVSGRPITTFCREERLGLRARLGIFLQVCRAVQHAHQKGIIHRDLKPSNMLVGREGDHFTTKVIDFGIAKAARADGDPRTQYTRLNLFVGTPDYMSPEQLDGATGDIDTRSDVFSLGAVLYELLTGAPPFDPRSLRDGSTPPMQHLLKRTEPQAPSQRLRALGDAARSRAAAERGLAPERLVAELKGDLDQIVLKCLEPARSRRYDSVENLARDVDNFLCCEPVSARPATLRYRAGKFTRRHALAVAISGGALLALGAVVGFYTYRLAAERDLAKNAARRAEGVSALLIAQLDSSDPYHVPKPDEQAELLARVRTDLAADPAARLDILSSVGRVLLRRGQHTPAQAVLEEAVAAGREVGHPLPYFGQALNDLGVLHRERADFGTARRFLEEAVRVRHQLLAEVGPNDEAVSLVELGRTCIAVDEFERAESLYQRALHLRRLAYGSEHREVATNLDDVAEVEWLLGHVDNAAILARQSHEMFGRTVGKEHPNFSTSEVFLARVCADAGDLAGAEEMARDAMVRLRRVLGPRHWRTVRAGGFLGVVWRLQNRLDEAEQAARDTVGQLRDLPAVDPTLLAQAECELAHVLLQRADGRGAEPLLRAALARQEKAYPAASWRLAVTQSLLAEALLQQRRWAEAEPLLLAAHAILPDIAGPRGGETKATRERLVRLYQGMGKPELATPFAPRQS